MLTQMVQTNHLLDLGEDFYSELAQIMSSVIGDPYELWEHTKQQLINIVWPYYMALMLQHQPRQQRLARENMPMPRFVPEGVRDPPRYWMIENRIRSHGKQFSGGQSFPGWNDNEYNIEYNAKQLYVAGVGESDDEEELRKYAQFSSSLMKSRIRRELLRKSLACPRDSPYGRVLPRDPEDPGSGFGAMGFPIFH